MQPSIERWGMINIVIAFQVVLMVLMLISVFGVIGEEKDRQLRQVLAGMFFDSIGAFLVSKLWI